MTEHLRPHTSAWFEQLMLRDTQQAIHTGQIIAAAGREDVCSICGDTPARDYQLASDASVTIRLCTDCREIRSTNYGEEFQPMRDT
jgi:hypothetical protein